MNRIRAFWHNVFLTVATMACWVVSPGVALAQEETVGGTATAYTLPYMLVILCIALGMLVVCRSSRRRAREKPQQYGEE